VVENHVAHDRQAQAGAAGGPAAGPVDAVEPLEDPPVVAFGDADPLILYLEDHPLPV
jgi:hypothetical protein